MPKKIIRWNDADAALVRLAIRLIESMEAFSRTRRQYGGLGDLINFTVTGEQFDENAFDAPIGVTPTDGLDDYLAGVSGFVDEKGNRRGLESPQELPLGCNWAFTCAVLQALKEARAKLEGVCYPQRQKRRPGPVLTRNP